jgi:hypothetical protein
MPEEVESLEQCVAWIVWHLDQSAGRDGFKPHRPAAWLSLGRENLRLLPFYFDAEAYRNRPQCHLDHDWAKAAFRTLQEHVAAAGTDDPVVFWSWCIRILQTGRRSSL